MKLVDTHCHLFFPDLLQKIDEVIEDATTAGVTKMICVGTNIEDSQKAVTFASKYENVWAAAGVHPHDAANFNDDSKNKLVSILKQPKIVAIGEIGLDYYKDYCPKLVQQKILRAQIESTIDLKLPYIFHVRDAWEDFWSIFDSYPNLGGVVHSFSSGTKQLNAAISRGLFVGLNGIMTFTSDQAQLDAARHVPLEKLVLETDAPFLAPVPFRGKVCEPKHTANIAEFLASLRSESIEHLSKITTENAVRLFNLT